MCIKCKEELLIYSLSKDWEEARDEWEFYDYEEVQSKCLCGKKIKKTYSLLNKKTKVHVYMGSDCIDKFIFNFNKLLEILYYNCQRCHMYVKRENENKHNKSYKHRKNVW